MTSAVSIRSKFTVSAKNLLKAFTLPGLFILHNGICVTTYKPSIIEKTLDSEPDTIIFMTRLLPIDTFEDIPAVFPESLTYFASSCEAI